MREGGERTEEEDVEIGVFGCEWRRTAWALERGSQGVGCWFGCVEMEKKVEGICL